MGELSWTLLGSQTTDTPSEGLPAWAQVALAALALVGTLGGAWGGAHLASKRDDARWARQCDADERAYWRSRRAEVYADMVATWHEMRESAVELRDALHSDSAACSQAMRDCERIIRRLRISSSTVEIAAGRKVRMRGIVAVSQSMQFILDSKIAYKEMLENGLGSAEHQYAAEAASDSADKMENLLNNFIDAAREELEVP